jgi:hypothetical protein
MLQQAWGPGPASIRPPLARVTWPQVEQIEGRGRAFCAIFLKESSDRVKNLFGCAHRFRAGKTACPTLEKNKFSLTVPIRPLAWLIQ